MSPEPGTRATVAIEASTRAGSVALARGPGADIREARLDAKASHGRDLIPALDALVREAGLGPRDIGCVVVGRGPGSYTGLRVAAATALGLARSSGAALVGVASFEALALEALAPGERGAVLRDAFGGTAYFAAYEREAEGSVRVLVEPACAKTGDIRARLGDVETVLGDENIAGAVFGEGGPELEVPRFRATTPSAKALLELSRTGSTHEDADRSDVSPLYLRPFEAKVRAR